MRFSGKAILVTGGAMGIGAATVLRLSAEGATVIVADINEEAAKATIARAKDFEGEVWHQHVNLIQEDSIKAMAEEVAERVEALHGLVNTCGIKTTAPVSESTDADWEPQISINLRAPALCTRELLPLLKKGPGHIVNLSSQGVFTMPRSGSWVYDATKLGICALTRNLACELGPEGIRVNTVAPGWTVTEMHYINAPDPAQRKRELEEHVLDRAIIKRLARPEEIAAAIAFLLSDDASYITASTLHVDGGSAVT
jgi:NAD(P)-dependent dehydrogenase (short-subunit alcohol dehydrogenase family)